MVNLEIFQILIIRFFGISSYFSCDWFVIDFIRFFGISYQPLDFPYEPQSWSNDEMGVHGGFR